MIHYTYCPVCGSASIQPALEAKDYTVSEKTFPIWHCGSCTARFTQDIPEKEDIGSYYQSDNYISHSDTKEGLVNRLYHRIRAITLRSKRNLITSQSGLSKGRLLDIGCGTGAFLHAMKESGWSIQGLEPDPGAREKAANLYGLDVQPIEALESLSPGSFDVITLWHVLEHVYDPSAYVVEFKRLLKPGGLLVVAVPNYTSYDAESYGAFWAAYDVPRHLSHFSPQSMQLLMKKGGLEVKAMKPMWFDSFYVSMLSERYQHGKDRLAAAAMTGLASNLKVLGNPAACSSVIYLIRPSA